MSPMSTVRGVVVRLPSPYPLPQAGEGKGPFVSLKFSREPTVPPLPLAERVGVRASLSQRFKNRLQHRLRLPQHFVVPEPQNAKAAACEVPRAFEVFQQSFRVMSPVQFDYQPRSKAHEIHDVVPHRHLSTKAIPAELAVAYATPEMTFGVARMAA